MGSGSGGPGWEVVETKREPEKAKEAPAISAELRSYAEWFVWAKRAGADLSASHAAAKAAVTAAAAGGDALVAAQGAVRSGTVTAVDQLHQEYAAWFAVASVDLAYEPPRSHAFAEAGVAALHEGKDVNEATAAAQAAAAALPVAGPEPVPVAEKAIAAEPAPVTPVEPPPAPVETVAETIPPPVIAETIPPPGATAQLPAIPAVELAPEPEPLAQAAEPAPEPAAAPAPEPVPVPEPEPEPPPAPAAKTATDAVAAATAFAGLGSVTRSRAKLAATSELQLASGIEAVPEGVTADRAWVVSLLAGATAAGAALPETGCVVVMPTDLGQFWYLQAGARQRWPDWFERLPDHSGE